MESLRDEPLEAPAPDWTPTAEFIATTDLAWLMQRVGVNSYDELHAWSVRNRAEYWALAIERLGVRFHEPFRTVLDSADATIGSGPVNGMKSPTRASTQWPRRFQSSSAAAKCNTDDERAIAIYESC